MNDLLTCDIQIVLTYQKKEGDRWSKPKWECYTPIDNAVGIASIIQKYQSAKYFFARDESIQYDLVVGRIVKGGIVEPVAEEELRAINEGGR